MILLEKLEPIISETAIAVGLFDAVHLAHRKVISTAVEFAKKGLKPVVFTFNIDGNLFPSSKRRQCILNEQQKYASLSSLGVEVIVSPAFSEIVDVSPKDFVEKILKQQLNAKVIVCGHDYRFGKNAMGDTTLLKELCDKNDIQLIVMPKQEINGEKISSTAIKNYLDCGDIEKANQLLGYNYYIDLVVEKGMQLGRELGFPTINQHPDYQRLVLPKSGVYFTKTTIEDKVYKSITNVGVKPTIAGNRKPIFETHILNFTGNLYDKKIKVEFVKFLRNEQKFDNLDMLIHAINNDKTNVNELD